MCPLEKIDQLQEQRESRMRQVSSNLGSAAGLNGVPRPGLGAAWLLSDRKGAAAQRSGRRDALLLQFLGTRAGRRASAAHAQCTVGVARNG